MLRCSTSVASQAAENHNLSLFYVSSPWPASYIFAGRVKEKLQEKEDF